MGGFNTLAGLAIHDHSGDPRQGGSLTDKTLINTSNLIRFIIFMSLVWG